MNFVKSIPPRLLRDKFGFYQGTNRTGWSGEMDRCWIDNDVGICVTSRLIRTNFGNVEHVAISKRSGGNISWSTKMQIKNELFGENRFAIEVYPKQKNLVDVAAVYHLWVFDKKREMPFGIAKNEYTPAINRGYCITKEDLERSAADFARGGAG